MSFAPFRALLLVIIACWLAAADLPLTRGFRELAWGASREEVVAMWPKPIGTVYLDDTRSIYVIEPAVGLILDHDHVRGLMAGDIVRHSCLDALDCPTKDLNKSRIAATITLGMTRHDFCAALNLEEGERCFRYEEHLGDLTLTSYFAYTGKQVAERYVLVNLVLVDARFVSLH